MFQKILSKNPKNYGIRVVEAKFWYLLTNKTYYVETDETVQMRPKNMNSTIVVTSTNTDWFQSFQSSVF